MSRPSRSLAAALAVAALSAGGARAGAGPRLDVSGEVIATAPKLSLRVLVTNRGDQPAPTIEVTGEWQGALTSGRIAPGIPPGASRAVMLDFDPGEPGPGVHALPLLLEHVVPGAADAGGNLPVASERAWLLVAFGATPPPAVRLTAPLLRLEVRQPLAVVLESADGRPHHVRLRGFTPRGVRLEEPAVEVDVPASGAAHAALVTVRAGAARGTRHGILLVAETRDEGVLRTTVGTATVEVTPTRELLPRARKALIGVALVLLLGAVAVELWRAFRPSRRT